MEATAAALPLLAGKLNAGDLEAALHLLAVKLDAGDPQGRTCADFPAERGRVS